VLPLGAVAQGDTSSSTSTSTTTTTTPTPTVTLKAKPAAVTGAQDVVLTGTTAPAAQVQLFKSPYPFHSSLRIRTSTSAADGSFSFTVHPDRITRYRAVVTGTSAVAQVVVKVAPRTVIKVKTLPLGQAGVKIVLFHPRDLRWGGARVRWYFGHGRKGHFGVTVKGKTKKLSPYATLLATQATLPAGRFHWRVCLHVPGDHQFADPHNPVGCKGLGFWGRGRLPEGYPGSAAISRAANYLSHRAGRTAFAVVDSEGRESGVHEHWTFVSASVVKAMLLVAYLRRLDAQGQHSIDSYSNSFLYPMIHVSDNNAATQTWSIVGDSGLYSVAHAAGMTDFSIVGIWANAQISAYDQAKFFFEMDSLIPKEFVGYARSLLSGIAAYESWGIPAIARPRGYQVFFKGGWRGTGLGQLVHQIGRLEGHKRTFSIAVMTDGDPSMGYGIDTIQGITAALL
jgi:hypothetical protein